MFDDVNIFSDTNKKLRNIFFFYFMIAVCGYLALMACGYPYNDDYCRYLVNCNVGTISSARYFTLLIESFTYLSNVITDAAPFSQVLSCAFLSYIALICLKIFKVDLNNKIHVLCFSFVAINPYMLEIMLFRFDNPFSTLALLLVVASAYLSTFNTKKFFVSQTAMLFLSFFMYQVASSAYFIIFTYLFLIKIREGKTLVQVISEMRYWIYTILTVALCYFPFTFCLRYSVAETGSSFAIPTNLESINIIIANGVRYFSNLYVDWSDNTIGQISFVIFVIFVINMIAKTYLSSKSLVSVVFSFLGVFVFVLCPLGACLLLKVNSFEGNESVLPRSLYSFGILISLVCYDTCKSFEKIELGRKFVSFLMIVFGLWNIIFLNSSANVIRQIRMIEHNVLYDISKDIYDFSSKNENIKGICVKGSVDTRVSLGFIRLYPIIDRIIPEKWKASCLCKLAIMHTDFGENMLKYVPIKKDFYKKGYKKKEKVKEILYYDVYILDDKMLLFELRKNEKYGDKKISWAQIREGAIEEVEKKTE